MGETKGAQLEYLYQQVAFGVPERAERVDTEAGWYFVEGVRYCLRCRTRRCERQQGGSLRCVVPALLPIERRCEECAFELGEAGPWAPDPRFCRSCWSHGYGHGLAGGPVSRLSQADRDAIYPPCRSEPEPHPWDFTFIVRHSTEYRAWGRELANPHYQGRG